MLTIEQRIENKRKFLELLSRLNIDITPITSYLDGQRADFFNKPYSYSADFAYEGSLCEHSLKLYDCLKTLCDKYCPSTYAESDIITVALLKDIYRAELYEQYLKNVKNEQTGKWESVTSYRVKEVRPIFGNISFSSYMIARKFIKLDNDEVVEALCNSFISNTDIEICNIRKEYKLVTLTTIAELLVNNLNEGNVSND